MTATKPLTFWAQNLDNEGDDIFVRWDPAATPPWSNIEGEQAQLDAVDRISRVRDRGDVWEDVRGFRIDMHLTGIVGTQAYYILDIETSASDSAGRSAFFICSGEIEELPRWAESVRDNIFQFAADHGLQPVISRDDLLMYLKGALLKKKTRIWNRLLLVGGVGIGLAFFAWWWARS